MNYFVETVTVYSTSGKTRKGAAIQAAAKPFEHKELFGGQSTLNVLVARLRALVRVCNANFRGAELFLSWHRDGDQGQISVHPKPTGFESPVVTISYAPILDHISDLTIGTVIGEAIRKQAPEIYSKFLEESAKGGKP